LSGIDQQLSAVDLVGISAFLHRAVTPFEQFRLPSYYDRFGQLFLEDRKNQKAGVESSRA